MERGYECTIQHTVSEQVAPRHADESGSGISLLLPLSLPAMIDWVSRLPNELILRVLDHLSLKNIVRVSHVCRRWRALAFEHPTYGSPITLHIPPRPSRHNDVPLDMRILQLTRSSFRPVELSIICHNLPSTQNLEAFIAACRANFGRIGRFDATVHGYATFRDTILKDFLMLPAPIMTQMSFRGAYDLYGTLPPSFATLAPNLRALSLFHLGLAPDPSVPFMNLEVLSVEGTAGTPMPRGYTFPELFPNLRTLKINHPTFRFETEMLQEAFHTWARRLQCLHLDTSAFHSLQDHYPSTLSTIQDIFVRQSDGRLPPRISMVLTDFGRDARLRVYIDGPSPMHYYIFDISTDRTRTRALRVHVPPPDVFDLSGPPANLRITQLDILITTWNDAIRMVGPDLVALELLVLRFHPSYRLTTTRRAELRSIVCPSLTTLRLTANPPHVDSSPAVIGFVQRCLPGISPGVLRLELRVVSIYEGNSNRLTVFFTVVDHGV